MQLQVETSAHCNKACFWCPYPTMVRPKGFMSWELYTKIVDEASTIPLITELCITGLGETLIDKLIVDRVRYARSRMPNAIIDIYTNGSLLSPERFEALKDAGVSAISISLNAVTAEQHFQVMKGQRDFDLVVKNTEYAIANRDKVTIEVKAVVNGDSFTDDDTWKFYATWGWIKTGGHGQVVKEGNWAGLNRTMRETLGNSACHRALGQIYVLWNGKVTACCWDPDGTKATWGDLNTQSLREVYASEGYLGFREAHSENQAGKYDFCMGCNRI